MHHFNFASKLRLPKTISNYTSKFSQANPTYASLAAGGSYCVLMEIQCSVQELF